MCAGVQVDAIGKKAKRGVWAKGRPFLIWMLCWRRLRDMLDWGAQGRLVSGVSGSSGYGRAGQD